MLILSGKQVVLLIRYFSYERDTIKIKYCYSSKIIIIIITIKQPMKQIS